ncbi:hypothetical protein [Pseudomonas asturiensis]|uniref:hypothetical protein n=1 Tax=Pseudomonas asturiensis TaxID=1190415 RepID=UPI0011306CD8|nr:hypothetical protein [Pseudomonas asturiensis]
MSAFQPSHSANPAAIAVSDIRVVVAHHTLRDSITGKGVEFSETTLAEHQYDIIEIHSETPYRLSDEIDIYCQPFAADGRSLSMMCGVKGC